MRLLTREALLSFRRAPLLSALSITTIAFSLFTVGLFGLVAINLRQALHGLEERVEIVAFVLRGTPAETITLATHARRRAVVRAGHGEFRARGRQERTSHGAETVALFVTDFSIR